MPLAPPLFPPNFAGIQASTGQPLYLNERGMTSQAWKIPAGEYLPLGPQVVNGGPCACPDEVCVGGVSWQLVEYRAEMFVLAGCGHYADLTRVPTAEQVLAFRRAYYGTDDGEPRP